MASIINAATSGGLISTADTSGILQLQTASTTAVTVNASQNVGIGTSSPAYKLDTRVTGTGNVANFQSDSGPNIRFTGTEASGRTYQIGEGLVTAGSFSIYDTTGSAERLVLNSSGNLGLGVTPSAWTTSFGFKALDIGQGCVLGATSDANLIYNAFFNSSNAWIYKTTAAAARYQQSGATHAWYSAASGTAGNAITFTQAMTLDASGHLLVGKTSKNNTSGNGFQCEANGTVNVVTSSSTSSFDTYEIYSTGAGAYRFYVTAGGVINATSTSITAISDQRLKENVRPLELGLAEVLSLQPRRYDWIEGKGQNKKDAVGFIAQEFEVVLPNSVGTSKAGEDGIEYKNINYEELMPTLVKAIQEQQALIQSLKARLDAANL
jgi:hypothetical protein